MRDNRKQQGFCDSFVSTVRIKQCNPFHRGPVTFHKFFISFTAVFFYNRQCIVDQDTDQKRFTAVTCLQGGNLKWAEVLTDIVPKEI